jgi:hypothetical protein
MIKHEEISIDLRREECVVMNYFRFELMLMIED